MSGQTDTGTTGSRIVGDLHETANDVKEVDWRIPDVFSMSDKPGDCYDSRRFSFAGERWRLRIHAGARNMLGVRYVSVSLLKEVSTAPDCRVRFRLGLRRADGSVEERVRELHHASIDGVEGRAHSSFLRWSDLLRRRSQLASSDVLSIVCSLRRKGPPHYLVPVTAEDMTLAGTPTSRIITENHRFRRSPILACIPWSSSSRSSSPARVLGVIGRIMGTTKEVEWRIPDVLSLFSNPEGAFYESSRFPFVGQSWYLRYFPGRPDGEFRVHLRKEASATECRLRFALGFRRKDGSTKRRYGGHGLTFGKDEGGFGYRFPHSSLRFSSHVVSGVLTIVCTLWREGPDPVDRGAVALETAQDKAVSAGITQLSRDLSGLMLSGDDSDVTVEVKGVEFRLHRAILRARAPAFAAALRRDTTAAGVVRLDDDCEPHVFWAFVRHVYSGDGRLEELLPVSVLGLFALADKYQLEELKSACLELMKVGLTAETFCDVYALALSEEHEQDGDFLERAADYFALNVDSALRTPQWMNFMKEHPVQANELLLKSAAVSRSYSNLAGSREDWLVGERAMRYGNIGFVV